VQWRLLQRLHFAVFQLFQSFYNNFCKSSGKLSPDLFNGNERGKPCWATLSSLLSRLPHSPPSFHLSFFPFAATRQSQSLKECSMVTGIITWLGKGFKDFPCTIEGCRPSCWERLVFQQQSAQQKSWKCFDFLKKVKVLICI